MSTIRFAAMTAALVTSTTVAQAAEIEFWFSGGERDDNFIQTQCAAFNESQSRHSITCILQGSYDESMQKAIAAVRSARQPELIQFFDAGTLDVMMSDTVVPVQELIPDAPWDTYLNGARSYYETSTGELFSQPYNGSTLVFYGNMEMLGKAGISELPETYEELEDTMRALQDAGVDCAYTTDGHPWRVLEQFSARHGVPIASNHNGYSGLDSVYSFQDGLALTHLENIARWREDGLVKLNQDTIAGRYNAAFNAGECAMMEASTSVYSSAYAAFGDNVRMGLAPMYEGHERRNTLIGGASIWVMQGHDDPEYAAAAEFLNFIRQPEQQLAFTETLGVMPVTTTAIETLRGSDDAEKLEFATAELGVSSLNQPGTDDSRGIRLGFYVQFRSIFQEETQAAFNGQQSMQEAVNNAAERGDELLRRFEQTYQGRELP